jgi:hypothetical protein
MPVWDPADLIAVQMQVLVENSYSFNGQTPSSDLYVFI